MKSFIVLILLLSSCASGIDCPRFKVEQTGFVKNRGRIAYDNRISNTTNCFNPSSYHKWVFLIPAKKRLL